MAARKANGKTKPSQARIYGETDADDSFVPPDRQDSVSLADTETGVSEVIDFRKGTSEVADDQDGDDVRENARRAAAADSDDPPLRERPVRQQQARGDDRDDEGLSRSVQKRVARERAITNRERALREQAETKLREERVARQATEDRITRIERTQKQIDANGDVKSIEAKIQALIPQIATATEAGETKKALELQIQLSDLQGDLKVLKYDLKLRSENATAIEAREKQNREAAAGTERQVHPADQQENIERGNAFKRENRHWWRRRENDVVRKASEDMDVEILNDIRDGVLEFKPYSDEHFEELAQRLHEEYPDLELIDPSGVAYEFEPDQDDRGGNSRRENRVQNNRGRDNGRPPQGRSGSLTRGNRQPDEVENARLGRVTLTQADYDQMRTFKLDPNNPNHKRKFAEERARTILARDTGGSR